MLFTERNKKDATEATPLRLQLTAAGMFPCYYVVLKMLRDNHTPNSALEEMHVVRGTGV